MNRRLLSASALTLIAPAAIGADAPDLDGVVVAQVLMRERIVIRIPRLPAAAPAMSVSREYRQPAPTRWDERKAPRCVPIDVLAGASINRDGDVDLVATDGRRLRAKLDDDCPTLNFYRGFYLKRGSDGKLCAGRDSLRSRSGARCGIDKFHTLVARK